MRTRWRWLLVLTLAVVLVGGPAAWWLARPAPRITAGAYERLGEALTAGPLTLADVEAILGGPPGNYDGDEPGTYLPQHILRGGPDLTGIDPLAPDPAVRVVKVHEVGQGQLEEWHVLMHADVTAPFMPIRSWGPAVSSFWSMNEFRALPQPRRVVVWTGPYYAIGVQLDADDRVINGCLAKNFREPGRWERWREWLGF